MDQALLNAFRFFHEHAGYIVGQRAVGALALARAELRAESLNLEVRFVEEEEAWDGEGPAPNHVMFGYVRDPREDGPGYAPLASLGMIGFDSFQDPYVRVVSAEILADALAALDEQNDRAASREAEELSARATYAG